MALSAGRAQFISTMANAMNVGALSSAKTPEEAATILADAIIALVQNGEVTIPDGGGTDTVS